MGSLLLVHRRVTLSSMPPVLIDKPGWRETMWGTPWQGLGVESPTFRSEVQRINHYTTAPPHKKKVQAKETGSNKMTIYT